MITTMMSEDPRLNAAPFYPDLDSFAEQYPSDVMAEYLITGIDKATGNYTSTVVPNADRESFRATLRPVFGEHVYAVHPVSLTGGVAPSSDLLERCSTEQAVRLARDSTSQGEFLRSSGGAAIRFDPGFIAFTREPVAEASGADEGMAAGAAGGRRQKKKSKLSPTSFFHQAVAAGNASKPKPTAETKPVHDTSATNARADGTLSSGSRKKASATHGSLGDDADDADDAGERESVADEAVFDDEAEEKDEEVRAPVAQTRTVPEKKQASKKTKQPSGDSEHDSEDDSDDGSDGGKKKKKRTTKKARKEESWKPGTVKHRNEDSNVRRELRTETFMDERGYMVTEERWVDVEVDEPPPAPAAARPPTTGGDEPKQETKKPTQPAPTKKSKQGSLFSFLKRS